MLPTYSAMIIDNQIQWLEQVPDVHHAHVMITILDSSVTISQPKTEPRKRQPPHHLKGLGQELGDIVQVEELNQTWQHK